MGNVAAKRAYISEEQLLACTQPTLEICDEIDNDCNEQVDESGVCDSPPSPIVSSVNSSEESSELKLLSADFNADGCVNFDDFFLLADMFGKHDKQFDLSKNGVVDYDDAQIFEKEFGKGTCG